ncbi:MAG: helix-turn-helix transcriptional regulator, partial [Deltaproteobacteria bacterium]|nr:helix-turn-helix transcriptional regulator [Deltaproteobacteria bacterium]
MAIPRKTSVHIRRPGLSERQIRRREHQKKKILSAASRLFWKKGYNGTSIEDIAKTADVNKAT